MEQDDHTGTDEDLFERLGRPEHQGHAFAITMRNIQDNYDGDPKKVLAQHHPSYEHRILRDRYTENIIVVRPDANGAYNEHFAGFERLR